METVKSPTGTNKAVVIYHANCVDGFASAWAFHTLKENDYPGGVWYQAMSYGQQFDQIWPRGKHVDCFIVDFSFDRKMLDVLARSFNKILVLDHHKTAAETLTTWEDKPKNLEIVFDMERSGCGITWDYFVGNERRVRPLFLNYIEDRDLWRFQLRESKEVNAFITFQDKTFNVYNLLNEFRLIDMARDGSLLMEQHQKFCEQMAEDARPLTISNGLGESWNGLASNCTPQFSSEVGNLLANRSGTFGATYHSQKDGLVKWSIRSVGDYDVAAIAKLFGGGGHRNAAGFVVKLAGENADSKHIYLWTYPPESAVAQTGAIL